MANYAVIKDSIVYNVIVADTQAIAETLTGLTCVEVSTEPGSPGVGWTYDGANFSIPVIEVPAEENL